jgi:hypothetical protein
MSEIGTGPDEAARRRVLEGLLNLDAKPTEDKQHGPTHGASPADGIEGIDGVEHDNDVDEIDAQGMRAEAERDSTSQHTDAQEQGERGAEFLGLDRPLQAPALTSEGNEDSDTFKAATLQHDPSKLRA